MEHTALFARIDALTPSYISFWSDVCSIESPTHHKAGVDAVGAYFIARAKALGWEVEVFEQPVSGNCVTITMNPDAPLPPIALSGHMDTVHPVGLFGDPPVRIEGDTIYGPGVGDCKGGVVASFLAMEALRDCGFTERPVRLILQSDEEGSSLASNKATVAYMARAARDCVAFLNTEPRNEGFLTIERKGIVRYRLDVHGKAAHASLCYTGKSAIAEAAYKILELEKWKDADGITCNCGIIEGGTTVNSVPAECSFTVDIRYKSVDDLPYIDRSVREIAAHSYLGGTTCTCTVASQRVPMERTARNEELLDRIALICQKTGLGEVKPRLTNGGSDASDMTAYGIPALDSFGVCCGAFHSAGEYARISSLAESAKLQAAVVFYFDLEKEQL